MKISPESFVVDEKLCLNYKVFFISGNDENYIYALKDLLVKSFSNKGFIKKNITNESDMAPDLFEAEKKYVYVCEKYIGDNSVEEINKSGDVLIYYEKSSAKNKPVKQLFSNSKDRVLLDCYELDQSKKTNIVNAFIKKHNLVFEKNIYWLLLDLLDNKFPILIKELDKVLLLDNKNDIDELGSALSVSRSIDASKFFFKIHLSRSNITPLLNSSVNSLADFYSYFSYFKIYSLLLFGSKNKTELERKIPKYLFKEKQGLLGLFESLSENKKKLLSSLMLKTEKLVRKNPSLYKSLFFRFVLNYKKIIS